MGTGHFRKLSASDEEAARSGAVPPVADVFRSEVDGIRTRWQQKDLSPTTCGLMPVFCEHRFQDARTAYVTLCDCLDRIVSLVALRPYHQLSAAGGDLASVKLRKQLAHWLQELERAVMELRQARLQLTNVAKQRLQDLAKISATLSSASEDYRWMQCLRYMDTADADASFQDIVTKCAEIRSTLTSERAFELQQITKKELTSLADQYSRPEFQARLQRLPDAVQSDMQALTYNLRNNVPAQQALSHAPGQAALANQ